MCQVRPRWSLWKLHEIVRIADRVIWVGSVVCAWSFAQTGKSFSQEEWAKLLDAESKEKRIVVSVPAGAEFRKQLEENFKKKFGIEVEVFTGRGSSAVRRMAF